MRAEARRIAHGVLGLALIAVVPQSGVAQSGGERVDIGSRIVIGSKAFTESYLLAELMALVVEEHTELEVEHRQGFGGTLLCFGALEAGEIDLYPEYTGTGWSVILGRSEPLGEPLRAFTLVQAEFRRRDDLEWLAPFGLNNTYAIAVRGPVAQRLGLRRISDLREHAAELRAGFSHEFLERPDGYAGLVPHYGFELEDVRGLEHALAYEALEAGALDLTDAYSTDGKLLRYELSVLEDDRGFFPPYNAAPLVRGETLRRHPELGEALSRLAFRVSDGEMMDLNHEVESGDRPIREVARAFLISKGLLSTEGAPAGVEVEEARQRKGTLAFLASRWRETLRLVLEHLQLTLVSVLLAALFAIPLGIWITADDRLRRLSLGFAGVMQTVPSLALLAVMVAVPGLGISIRSAILALFLYALLPILRNTYAGLAAVDPELLEAARAMGLTRRQVLLRIQLPLATRTIMAGLRTATVISIGVATLAAFIGAGGLGEPIVTGLSLNDPRLVLSGALPAAALALVVDLGLARLERRLVPRGLRLLEER